MTPQEKPAQPEPTPAKQDKDSSAPEDWVWLARIRRPQGRKGEVFADILTDFPEKFAERRRLWLVADPESPHSKVTAPPSEVELRAHWLHKGGVVLHFSGVDSISAAELLAGKIVSIPLAERTPLAEDEIYIADLIGCTLFDVTGADVGGATPVLVGQIEDVDRTAGPVALLVVVPQGTEEEVLVPFAKSYLRRIDLADKRVEMALPEGLVELNATGKA
ncbi:MAG: ribosome maturation factor RimM [Terracidiphilus sp.]